MRRDPGLLKTGIQFESRQLGVKFGVDAAAHPVVLLALCGGATAHVGQRFAALHAHIHVLSRVCKNEVLIHMDCLSVLPEIVQTRKTLQA